MTIEYLIEYLKEEKRLRGVCVREDPSPESKILKNYILPEKYIRKPLWCISSDNFQTIGIITIESCKGIYGDLEISHYEWNVSEFHPVNRFQSPFKTTKKAPTISFAYPGVINEEFFNRISSFKTFLTD